MLFFSVVWLLHFVYATKTIYANHSCLDDFAVKYAAASTRPEACATMLVHGLPCVNTALEKTWFLKTFDNGTCAFLSHLVPTAKPNKTKRGVLDWLDSVPHQQGTLPETMHKIWSYHAHKLKNSKYRYEAEGARSLSRHYARQLVVHDTSGASIKKWSAFTCSMLAVSYLYLF